MFKDSNMSKQVTVVRSSAFCSQAHLGKVKMIQNSSNPQALPDRSGHCRFPLFPPVSTFQSKFCQGSKANATGAIWLPWLVVHWLSFRSYLCHPVSMQLSGIEFNKRNTKWPSCGQAKQDAAALRLECGHNLWVWGRSPDRGPLEGAARLSTKHARRLQGLRCLATRGAFPYCRESQANLCLPFCSALFASKRWTWHDMTHVSLHVSWGSKSLYIMKHEAYSIASRNFAPQVHSAQESPAQIMQCSL